jgi:hypothetical protein
MAEDDEDLRREEVERRREPRGVFPGLRIDLTAPRAASFEAVEASRRGFFVRVDDPDAYALGGAHEAVISLDKQPNQVKCRLEVIRKEIEPRRGVALRIATIDPRNEELLKQLLGPAGDF